MLFNQMFLEGLGIEAPEEKKTKKEKKEAKTKQNPAAKKPAPKGAEVLPLRAERVVGGTLICPPLILELDEKKSVGELRQLLGERSFLEAEYFEMFQLNNAVLAALPYAENADLAEAVSPEDRMVHFGDAVSVPADDGTYSVKDLLDTFISAYPEYAGASAIKLSDGMYAPMPVTPKLKTGMVISIGEKEYPVSETATTLAAVVAEIPELAGIKKLPVELRAVISGGKLMLQFYYRKKAVQAAGTTAPEKKETIVKLPVKLAFTFGVPATVLTPEDFEGKAEVPMSEIKNRVFEKYTALKDVKTDFCYMQNVPVNGAEGRIDMIQVLVYMQGKGAGFFPAFETREEAKAFLDSGSGDAARFQMPDGNEPGKMQRVPAGTFVQYPGRQLEFTPAEKMPKAILLELIAMFRKAMPMEDVARVYRRNDGTFFVHHLQATTRTRFFVNFNDGDIPPEAWSGNAALFCEAHSHNSMHAFFSKQDFVSAVYPGLYVCIGRLDQRCVEIAASAQMDWNAVSVRPNDVFAI